MLIKQVSVPGNTISASHIYLLLGDILQNKILQLHGKKYLKVTKLVNGRAGILLEFIALKKKIYTCFKLNTIQLNLCDMLVKCPGISIPTVTAPP